MPIKMRPFLLSLLAALLLSAGWIFHFAFFAFFGFVPLLMLESHYRNGLQKSKASLKLFAFLYIAFFLWNLIVTWWVAYASFSGACLAIILNALLMAIVFQFYSAIKNRLNQPWAIWLIIPIWLAWEHGHSVWDLTWTWLTLGNVFAFNSHWIQWYEFTGVSGGSFWILFVNVIVYQNITQHQGLAFWSKPIAKMVAVIVLPVVLSYGIYFSEQRLKDESIKVLVVQPNVDPYNEKFTMDFRSQFLKMLNLVRGKINAETDYLVLPETFITENLNEAAINDCDEVQWFKDSLLQKYPHLKIISGCNSYLLFEKGDQAKPATAREDGRGFYYDVYNSAIQIDSNGVQVYHKSKLVPGVERMPFPALMKPLEKLAIDLGGTMGSLGTQAKRSVLSDSKHHNAIAPVICYESIFADYVTEYIRLDANYIFIITNDGWWDNSPGFVHHLNYAKLRAIENRRQIARCANTGISCFIDEFGEMSAQTNWWKEAVIEKKMQGNKNLTFFSAHGDILSYSASILAICLLFVWLFLRIKQR